jgi:D-glycero-alpha-D-manno-heptose-7-phosphate kinase
MLKRRLSDQIAPPFVDDIYARARAAGALGGKLLGAGGGGFMLFFVSRERQEPVLKALEELLVVPIELERSGTQLIHYDPRHYSQTARQRRDYHRYNGGHA